MPQRPAGSQSIGCFLVLEPTDGYLYHFIREIGRGPLITGIEHNYNFTMPFEPTKWEISSEKTRFKQQTHVIHLLVLAIERPRVHEQDGARASINVEVSNSTDTNTFAIGRKWWEKRVPDSTPHDLLHPCANRPELPELQATTSCGDLPQAFTILCSELLSMLIALNRHRHQKAMVQGFFLDPPEQNGILTKKWENMGKHSSSLLKHQVFDGFWSFHKVATSSSRYSMGSELMGIHISSSAATQFKYTKLDGLGPLGTHPVRRALFGSLVVLWNHHVTILSGPTFHPQESAQGYHNSAIKNIFEAPTKHDQLLSVPSS